MASDALITEMRFTAPLQGVGDGLDEALPDELYPPTFARQLSNVRVAGGTIATRKGMVLWKTLSGSGAVRLLDNVYEADGTKIRLAARGDGAAATLYDYVEGTDSAFAATSGGTSLGGTTHRLFQGETLDSKYYFTDRAGALRKYQETPPSGNQVRSVALPARPSAAPGVKAKTYEILDAWAGNSGVAPFGWTVSDATKFDLQDGTGTLENPLGGTTALLNTLTNPKNSPITENVSAEAVPSNTIAWWEYGSNTPTHIVFQYGQITATDFTEPVSPNQKEQWLPRFVQIGSLGTINFKRFLVVQNSGAADTYLSKIVLPGRLQGAYRWIYTHYDPTLLRESEPSDISNSGAPLDLSMIGVTGLSGTAAAFQKSAALTFTSDVGTDTTTTKIRIYRSGGTPSLTVDGQGRTLWLRVGEVFDQSTTLSNSPVAGATSFTVTSATNLAIGDWLVINKGTVSSEEFVRVTNVSGTTITISNGLQYAHSSGQSVQIAFVDNVPNESVDVTATIELERDDPPAAARFVLVAPDGRLVLANFSGKPTGIAWSNRATPDRPTDYEVFPDGVDPLTRRSLLQGWRVEIGGDPTDEEITSACYFQGKLTVFTKRRMYRIHAFSQADWAPGAIDKALDWGCVAGDTVREVGGWLYWVAPGPQVVRWGGQGQPEVISHHRIDARLREAEPRTWAEWFAVAHTQAEGTYYKLYCSAEDAVEVGACDVNIGPASATDCHSATGMLAWFKADSLVLNDGDPVASWTDSSGNGWTATRAVSAEQPVYASTSIPGGGPIVRFTTTSKGLDITGLSVVRASYTFYLLFRNTPGSPSFGVMLGAQSSGGGFSIYPDRSPDSTLRWFVSGNTAVEAEAVCGWQVCTVVADEANSEMRLYRNGVEIASGAYSPGTETDVAWIIGSFSGFPIGAIFDLAEVQLYEVVQDDATILSRATCLRNRWNLAASQGAG